MMSAQDPVAIDQNELLGPPTGGERADVDIADVIRHSRQLVLRAMSEGWRGPPFDPVSLALMRGISVEPRADIQDARVVPIGDQDFRIEFNPNRPLARIRYSVAHEIAHTLFRDCRTEIRNRGGSEELDANDWHLEMLCNIAAAEILMPFNSLPELDDVAVSIELVTELRRKYEVSTEAVLLRIAKLSRRSLCAFALSRRESGPDPDRYKIDYLVRSSSWSPDLRREQLLPSDSSVSNCTAIGFTAKGNEIWGNGDGRIHFEAIGIPPYKGRLYPRVVGFLRPIRDKETSVKPIEYLVGDATQPKGRGNRLLAHVVNDKTPNWGAGFASVVKKKWPIVQRDFQQWARSEPTNLSLGNMHITRLESDFTIAHMVCQHGYGTTKPGIRYDALADCLELVGEYAVAHDATVHMPRIGTGQAGGSWPIVAELIEDAFGKRKIKAYVYDLPGASKVRSDDQLLFGRRK